MLRLTITYNGFYTIHVMVRLCTYIMDRLYTHCVHGQNPFGSITGIMLCFCLFLFLFMVMIFIEYILFELCVVMTYSHVLDYAFHILSMGILDHYGP
jgi:hypothetical protein